MNAKYIGIKAPEHEGFSALIVIISGFCRRYFNPNHVPQQQANILHHPSQPLQLTEDSKQKEVLFIQRELIIHFVARIRLIFIKARNFAEAKNTELKEQIKARRNQHADFFRQIAVHDFLVSSFTNDRKIIPLHILNDCKAKSTHNKVLLKTPEA